MQLARLSTFLTSAALAAVVMSLSCGTDAVGVEACRQIEEARCYRALECGISLASPVHRGDDVAACVKFYKDDCLHGLASKNDPGGPKLQACVQAISGGVCSVVVAPETDPACAFLIPAPAAVVDAGADVDAAARPATDAASD